jgi:hypothetical protein
VLETNLFAIEAKASFARENQGRKSTGRRGRKDSVERRYLLPRAETLSGILVRDDSGSGGVEPAIAVRVIKMPVGVDEVPRADHC